MNDAGLYQLSLSKPIHMVRMSEPAEEIRYNAEIILKIVENHIRSHPTQWQMYYPLWPNEKTSSKS